jgi:hypothetical protein
MSMMSNLLLPNSPLAYLAFSPEVFLTDKELCNAAGVDAAALSGSLDPGHFSAFSLEKDKFPLALPFRETVERDIKSGLINSVLGVEGRVSLRDVIAPESNQSSYAYFELSGLGISPNYCCFTLSPFEMDLKGRGRLAAIRYFEMHGRENPMESLREIDLAAHELVRKNGDRFYSNATRKVAFKTREGERCAYYKFTPAMGVEILTRQALAMLGFQTSEVYRSDSPNAFWMRDEGEKTIGKEIFKERFRSLFEYFDTYRKFDAAGLLGSIARFSVAMFVLGNHDAHAYNALITKEGTLKSFDFETAGTSIFFRSLPEQFFYDFYSTCFSALCGMMKPDENMQRIGMSFLNKEAPALSEILDRFENIEGAFNLDDELCPRLVLAANKKYRRTMSLNFIPYYYVPVTKESFLRMIRNRLQIARQALAPILQG